MNPTARLLGLDVGSTTTHLLAAEAAITRNCVTGRREFAPPVILARPPAIFTPLTPDGIDVAAVMAQLDVWLAAIDPETFEAGGVLLTGLAAEAKNATALRTQLRTRLGNLLIAAAADPHFESWLAFHGSCGRLSTAEPDQPFLNLDVGGGTTNLALGQGGEVLATASLWIGARHVRFDPGTRRVIGTSSIGARVLAATDEPAKFFVDALTAFLAGRAIPDWLVDAPWSASADLAGARITLSGGVGELFYARRAKGREPAGTAFGDLGEMLAECLLDAPWIDRVPAESPSHGGRATVAGITLHSTELSGATIHLDRSDRLPLTDVPLLGQLAFTADEAEIFRTITGVPADLSAVAISLVGDPPDREQLRNFGAAAGRALAEAGDRVTVFLTGHDIGKTLGNYLTAWGTSPRPVIVLDEIPTLTSARFLQLGRPVASTVPLTLYGLQ